MPNPIAPTWKADIGIPFTQSLADQFVDYTKQARGVISETVPGSALSLAQILTDGTAYFVAANFHQGDVITNLSIQVTTGGSGTSLSKLGVYDAAGVRLALTADQGTAWNSSGTMTAALTSPWTVPYSGMFYLAVIAKAATTLPTVRCGAAAGAQVRIGTAALLAGSQTGQTDLPSPATIAAGGTAASYWIAAS